MKSPKSSESFSKVIGDTFCSGLMATSPSWSRSTSARPPSKTARHTVDIVADVIVPVVTEVHRGQVWHPAQVGGQPARAVHLEAALRGAHRVLGLPQVQPELRRRQVDHPPVPTTLAFNAATIAVFMRALRAHHDLSTGGDVELFEEVRLDPLQLCL
ncbi:hypothetical protein C6P46_002730 [Rhodotorula mucilaginosa]|uniref:Uncharacterized protein n=1 Tax=Rhodotorula mucilaginosa TaxID=5537 RepID=A0A9P7B702_RHOMI|nr:hypothetical protein C6P46_002730 [Rhodotorula mucilaginosa]